MTKRMSVSLPDGGGRQLKELSEWENISENEAIKRAVSLAHYIMRESRTGAKFYIERPGEGIRGIVIR